MGNGIFTHHAPRIMHGESSGQFIEGSGTLLLEPCRIGEWQAYTGRVEIISELRRYGLLRLIT
jgi:hypothetical protein